MRRDRVGRVGQGVVLVLILGRLLFVEGFVIGQRRGHGRHFFKQALQGRRCGRWRRRGRIRFWRSHAFHDGVRRGAHAHDRAGDALADVLKRIQQGVLLFVVS